MPQNSSIKRELISDVLYFVHAESIIVTYEDVTWVMGKTVLVVEDDVDLIGIYKEILELHEFDVQTALNGEEGSKNSSKQSHL